MKQIEKIFATLIEVFIETTSPVYKEEVDNSNYFSYQNSDLWQSIAKINPFNPVSIILVNNIGEILEYGFINQDSFSEQLLSGEMAIINHIPQQAYLFTEPENFINYLKYDLIVTNNLVTVKIKLSKDKQVNNRILNLAPDGSIYVF